MKKSIHLCIDMQNGYAIQYLSSEWRMLKANIEQLTAGLARQGIDTIHIAYADFNFKSQNDEQYLPEMFGCYADVKRGLQALNQEHLDQYDKHAFDEFMFDIACPVPPHAPVAVKRDYSAATNVELMTYLKSGGFDRIILSGGLEAVSPGNRDEKCLTRTAIDLASAFDVCIAFEATNVFVEEPKMSFENLLFLRQRAHAPFNVGFESIDRLIAEQAPRKPRLIAENVPLTATIK